MSTIESELRLMRPDTLTKLKKRQEDLGQKLKDIGGDHEGGHDRATLHDAPAINDAINDIRAELARIGDLNNDVTLITPPTDLTMVSIGARVKVLFDGDIEPETFYVGGPEDLRAGVEPVLTYNGPLGQALMGKPAGVSVTIEKPSRQTVKLVKILGGEIEIPSN